MHINEVLDQGMFRRVIAGKSRGDSVEVHLCVPQGQTAVSFESICIWWSGGISEGVNEACLHSWTQPLHCLAAHTGESIHYLSISSHSEEGAIFSPVEKRTRIHSSFDPDFIRVSRFINNSIDLVLLWLLFTFSMTKQKHHYFLNIL